MESIQSKAIKALLRAVRYKRNMELSGDALKRNIAKMRLKESSLVPENLKRRFDIIKKEINGYIYYDMKPLNNVSPKCILYLHGGGNVYEITNLHWKLLGKLANLLRCSITIPIYPLAPEHLCDEVFDMLIPLYQQMLSGIEPADITIMGDSAGGGMSLSLAQLLEEKHLPQPGNLILLSPTLDVTMTNPEILEVEKVDPLLSTSAIIEFGKWFSGDKGSEHYLISPINGNFNGLGKISLFIGTCDLLYPDVRRLKGMMEENGIEINYFEYPSMIHVWPMLPFPESKKAIDQIATIINL